MTRTCQTTVPESARSRHGPVDVDATIPRGTEGVVVGQWTMRIGVSLFAVWCVLFALSPTRLPQTAPAVHYSLFGAAAAFVIVGVVLLSRSRQR